MESSPKRIAITGNAGSGKTYLAQKLASKYELPIIVLDDIFWASSSYTTKRPQEEVKPIIFKLCEQEKWVVEGVYGEFMEELLPHANVFFWLDLDWSACKESLLKRSEKQRHKQGNFQALLAYAEDYWKRDNMRSFEAHLKLYEGFTGEKFRFHSRKAVNRFLKSC